MSYIIRQATLLQKGNTQHKKKVDVFIKDGIIQQINQNISGVSAAEIKGHELFISSGWVDMRCSLTDPGFEHKDDLSSLLDSAASGGFTTVITLPNSLPKIIDKSGISYLKNASKNHLVNLKPTGFIEDPDSKNNLTEMYDMFQTGAVAFTNGDEEISNGLLRKALLYTKPLDAFIISHPSDKSLEHGGMVHESSTLVTTGLKMAPSISEYVSLSQQLAVAEYCNAPIHFSCISTTESVSLIREAKKRGLKVTCDVSIFNLCFTDERVLSFDENFKVYPPLRSESDQKALIDGILDGTIDAISSNHSSQNIESKVVEFDYAAYGVLSQPFMVAWYEKYLAKAISIDCFVNKLTSGPSSIINHQEAKIEEGSTANLTVLDSQKKWIFNEETNYSKSNNTHEWEAEQKGAVVAVFNNNCVNLY